MGTAERRKQAEKYAAQSWRDHIKQIAILGIGYGYQRSIQENKPVDSGGKPIPWYTYPAIEYLSQLDFSGSCVFEWGAGHSSLWWADHAFSVISVEDSLKWFGYLKPLLRTNQSLLLKEENYVEAICGEQYDVIAIDGSYRSQCAKAALEHLAPGGLIILDNSDSRSEASHILRKSDLIEVGMTGFGANKNHLWTTSLYFHHDFSVPFLREQNYDILGSMK